MRFALLVAVGLLALCAVAASVALSPLWLIAALPLLALAALGIYDVLQREHSILRNYPIAGHLRFLLEDLRPELQQYFIERDYDGRPYPRDVRSSIYSRAKLENEEVAFGTELDTGVPGYEWFSHSVAAKEPKTDGPQPRVTLGGPQCSRPYEMALLNVSAMSFGSLSGNAITALNRGAKRGGFAHDTGEGGLSDYHLQGGDLVWEIGSGYFGCRTKDGDFDPDQFAEKAGREEVKAVHVKLSQGAKPGRGGVMPAKKVTKEIAYARGVPEGEKCVSPASHSEFSDPRGLLEFVARLRDLCGGKPTGFKLCVGSRIELLAICKAIRESGIQPDFVIVDGGEGGTGAGPEEFADHVGTPLTEGLMSVHNALVGTGLRDEIRLGASGKVATGFDIARRIAQGADFTNAARAMMMSVGCIQSQRCHLNNCPVGVATQDPKRARALDVETQAERCCNYQGETIKSLQTIVAAQAMDHPRELTPARLMRRIGEHEIRTYAEVYEWLGAGELLAEPPESWAGDWERADPGSF